MNYNVKNCSTLADSCQEKYSKPQIYDWHGLKVSVPVIILSWLDLNYFQTKFSGSFCGNWTVALTG